MESLKKAFEMEIIL